MFIDVRLTSQGTNRVRISPRLDSLDTEEVEAEGELVETFVKADTWQGAPCRGVKVSQMKANNDLFICI